MRGDALISRALADSQALGGGWRHAVATSGVPPDLWGVLADPHRTFVSPHPPERIMLVAGLAVPLVVNLADPRQLPEAFVQAPRTAPRRLLRPPAEHHLVVWLDPLAAARLLRTPLRALGEGFVPVDGLRVPGGADLHGRILEARDDRERFLLADGFLRAALVSPRDVPEQVAKAWRILSSGGGRVPVARVDDEVGWSHQHLVGRFSHHLGVTPKRASRILRLERLLRAARRRPGASWADLAPVVGYADQAHLSREVREFTGTTPASLRRPRAT